MRDEERVEVKRRKEKKGDDEKSRKGETRSTERGCDYTLSHAANGGPSPPFLLYIWRTCATATPGDVGAILRPAATTGVRPHVKAGVCSSPTTRSLLAARCSLFAVRCSLSSLGSARLGLFAFRSHFPTSSRFVFSIQVRPRRGRDLVVAKHRESRSIVPPTVRCRLDIHQLRVWTYLSVEI